MTRQNGAIVNSILLLLFFQKDFSKDPGKVSVEVVGTQVEKLNFPVEKFEIDSGF